MNLGGYHLRAAGPHTATVLSSPLLEREGIVHGFATRQGGVSEGSFATLNFGLKGGDAPDHVRENAMRLALTVGFPPGRLFRARQVHGADVHEVFADADPAALLQRPVDGLVTAARGIAVGVVTADCVPVLFVDPQRHVVAAAHAGWRGIVAGVLGATIEKLRQRYGSRPEDLLIASGPCIGPCCYEVGEEVATRFAGYPGAVVHGPGRPHLDLPAAVRSCLLDAGVRSLSQPQGVCTRCTAELFFSFRRDGEGTGHHLSVIGLA